MQCPLCHNECHTFLHDKTEILYYHCHTCEYIFKSPECFQDFERQKERYNLHENNEDDEGYIAYFKRFLDFTLPLVGQPSSALDFGCGRTSLLANLLEDEGVACEYYDPIYHPKNLDDNKKYDLIVSTEVFEHLHDPKEVFTFLLDRLNEGGYLAFQTQFHPNEVEAFKKWYYHQDPTHIVFFTVQTFKVLCELSRCTYVADNGKNMVVMKKGL